MTPRTPASAPPHRTRRPRPPAAAALALAVCLALYLTPPAAAQDAPSLPEIPVAENTTLSLNATARELDIPSLEYNTTHVFEISLDAAAFAPPPNSTAAADADPPTRVLVAHFTAFHPRSDDDFNAMYRHGMPYILLSAAAQRAALPTAAPCAGERCTCGRDPPYTLPDDTADAVSDRVAFHAREQAAFVRLANLSAASTVRIALSNFPAATAINKAAQTDPRPVLRGRLVVRLVSAPGEACPVSVPDARDSAVNATALCGGNGECDQGVCACGDDHAGRFCTDIVLGWPPFKGKGDDIDSYYLPNGVVWSKWKEDPTDRSAHYQFNATLPPFARTWVRWRKRRPDRDAIVRVLVHSGMAGSVVSHELAPFELPRLRVFLRNASHTRKRCGDGRGMRPSRLTGELTTFRVERLYDRAIPYECGRLLHAKSSVDAVLYADATGYSGSDARKSIQVEFLIRTYSPSVDMCGLHANAIPLFLVPICLAIMAVSSTVIVVLLIVDRRHGFTNAVDVLSLNELDRMHPALVYGSPELPVAQVDPDTSTASLRPECSICLCPFEQSDPVRRLKCAHMYHCECVDHWLTKERASCPTCRAKARVEELSDRRHLRYLVQLGLWPIMAWRRYRARQRERRSADGQARGAAAEAEGGDEVEAAHTGNNQAVTNNDSNA